MESAAVAYGKDGLQKVELLYKGGGGAETAEIIDQFVKDLGDALGQHRRLLEPKMTALGGALTAIDFKRHLYAPLIRVSAEGIRLAVSPSLNDDETRFVDKLSAFIDDGVRLLDGKSLWLLRNKSRAGMGFFDAGNFHPDFVLWIDTPEAQYISFIDPKGLLRFRWTDPKIEFHAAIKDLEARLQPTSPDKRVALNSVIMSGTPSEELRLWWGKGKPQRREKNVFCLDEDDCIDGMMHKILGTEDAPSGKG
jgi:hypothetical protein